MDDEKPNLRPTKRNSANGKSLYLHYNPNQPKTTSYIQATSSDAKQKVNVTYSLDKHQRWELLDDLLQASGKVSSSSSDDDLSESDLTNSERRKKKKKSVKKHSNEHQDGEVKSKSKDSKTNYGNNDADDITYVAVVPSPRDKVLASIRRHPGYKNKRILTGVKFDKLSRSEGEQSEKEDNDENFSTDDDELYSYIPKHNKLQLNDFYPVQSAVKILNSKSKSIRSEDNNSPKATRKIFYRQLSNKQAASENPVSKSPRLPGSSKASTTNITSSIFCSIHLLRSDLTPEHLSKTYGKNFIDAQCYPRKYLIDLTESLKTLQLANDFDLFPMNSALNCYLVIVLNDNNNSDENVCRGHVTVNMDLNLETVEIESLSSSIESIYSVEDLITNTIEFIVKLPSTRFKPKESAINQRKMLKNEDESELSDSEFMNKQIRQIQILDKKDLRAKLENTEQNNQASSDADHAIRPEICTTCYSDMNESTPMTALKSCGHWLCNQCWKQYIESSIEKVKIILCPEWNCCSMVDVGTILSLVNVRCFNIYERNIEKCLVNLSRSYVKCPKISCSNIVQIIGNRMDQVRCPCGHQFCPLCKQELHFPATCTSYYGYIEEARKQGDLGLKAPTSVSVIGRNCVSCHTFIEKNGGCNHMTCRCGAEFCWVCTGYWADHYKDGSFTCPRPPVNLQKKIIARERNSARKFYYSAIFHRHERAYKHHSNLIENCKRLIGTIPIEKLPNQFDSSLIKIQIDKREALLQHCYQMAKYINYLHRICEFVAVAADGYANTPVEFVNCLPVLETVTFNLSQLLEVGKGYTTIEKMTSLHQTSERIIERLRHARRTNKNGYATS
ncbi:unnamed protein product [Adineta ricciae]|uniref:RBR-type E3 ubiquitin transferase n=1 Tax=Adineta ricciae TaxID=249248 RepID=A0A815ZGJ0_ADIRI|nr:unnamed protein product [Adineta ricciae]